MQRGACPRRLVRLIGVTQIGLALLATGLSASMAMADGFVVTGKLGGQFEMDSNPLLQKKGEKTLIGWTSTPQILLTGRTPDLSLDFNTRIDDGRFNQSGFNSTDLHNYGSLTYQGEKYYLKLVGSFDYDTTRTSELVSSGTNVAGIRHTGFSLLPEFGYQLSPVEQIVVSGSYSASFYADTTRFTNYESYGLTPQYQYSFTMRDTGTIGLQSSHFDTLTGLNSEGDSVGPFVGWTHKFSDRFTTKVDVGYHVIHNKSDVDGSSWDQDYFYDFALTYGEPGDPDIATISVQRSLQPQSSAEQVTETSINLKETHHFTPRFAAILAGSYHTKSYNVTNIDKQKDYLEGSFALQYNITQELVVGSSYRYRQQTTTGSGGTASGQTVLLTLTYSPNMSLVSW
jgi:opacity protein-like surface antigen